MSKVSGNLAPPTLVLPARLIGRPHVARVVRELEAVDSYMAAQAIRLPNDPPIVPGISRVLREAVEANEVNLADQKSRQKLLARLRESKDNNPIVHLTFANEPDILFLTETVKWFRENIDGRVLLSIGVQPNIIGGCVVRTPVHEYNLSFQKHFSGTQSALRDILIKAGE